MSWPLTPLISWLIMAGVAGVSVCLVVMGAGMSNRRRDRVGHESDHGLGLKCEAPRDLGRSWGFESNPSEGAER